MKCSNAIDVCRPNGSSTSARDLHRPTPEQTSTRPLRDCKMPNMSFSCIMATAYAWVDTRPLSAEIVDGHFFR